MQERASRPKENCNGAKMGWVLPQLEFQDHLHHLLNRETAIYFIICAMQAHVV